MNINQRALAIGVGAALLQALMLVAFAWPAANIAPRDVPIAVTGPQADMVIGKLTAHSPDAFEISRPGDAAAARAAIERRAVYGAIVTGDGPPRMLVASAASPAVAQQLTQIGQQLSAGAAAPVEDVVAADADDPRGAAFGAMVLPLVMSGLAAGVLISLLIPAFGAKALGLCTFGVVGGLLSMAIVHGWMSVIPGSYLVLSAVAGLASFAVAGAVVGLSAVIGRAGIGIAALTLLLIGNPFSAATSAPELLPQPWGAIGQLLPPGAAASLFRSVAFFDGARATGPLVVLLIWAVAGLALLAVAAFRPRTETAHATPVPVPATTG
ncbi:hypothetical protein [Nocardia vulneris]|uniref:ABC transporter permease n=1 Tax=Nocardia vulneris TaxID=1141657 RepID=A0ABR4Z852_9NOCA|nr:hypothetical protein [Nocardia vulneris]KIA61482.1 hypothetical protein FG87_30440 [Nocardia vulneris]